MIVVHFMINQMYLCNERLKATQEGAVDQDRHDQHEAQDFICSKIYTECTQKSLHSGKIFDSEQHLTPIKDLPQDFKHFTFVQRSDLHLIYARDIIHDLTDVSVRTFQDQSAAIINRQLLKREIVHALFIVIVSSIIKSNLIVLAGLNLCTLCL